MKYCSGCERTKPPTDFHKKGEGYHTQCKLCRNSKNRSWYESSNYKRVKCPNPREVIGNRRFWKASYKKSVRQATPDWVRSHYKSEMEYVYALRDEASMSGDEYHVDHIVPISHPEICGLHVPWNLQVLPADFNIAKSNKWNPSDTITRIPDTNPDKGTRQWI